MTQLGLINFILESTHSWRSRYSDRTGRSLDRGEESIQEACDTCGAEVRKGQR